MTTARDAAHLERNGLFEVAGRYWLDAALVAKKKENKLWAELRAHSCEKKGLRFHNKAT